MIKVIINADDLGLNPVVNERIESAINCGAISSTSILANTAYTAEVQKIYQEHSAKVSFGAHLNLTQGRSLTQSDILRKYRIIDDHGDFTNAILKLTAFEPELRNAIKEEWLAQIEQLREMGISLSHIDGHHHVHGMLPLEETLIKIALTNDIKRVRSRYRSPLRWTIQNALGRQMRNAMSPIIENPISSNSISTCTSPKYRSIVAYSRSIIQEIKWRRSIVNSGIRTTDYFGQYSTMFNKVNSGLKLPDGCVIELMCHPGHPHYEQEESAVNANLMSEILNFSLISYNEI